MSDIERDSQQRQQQQQYIRCPKCHRIIASRRVDNDDVTIEVIVRKRVLASFVAGTLACLNCGEVVRIENSNRSAAVPDVETIFRALR